MSGGRPISLSRCGDSSRGPGGRVPAERLFQQGIGPALEDKQLQPGHEPEAQFGTAIGNARVGALLEIVQHFLSGAKPGPSIESALGRRRPQGRRRA